MHQLVTLYKGEKNVRSEGRFGRKAEKQKKEKRKRIFLYICFAVLIGVICLLTTSIQTLDKVDISLFLGMSFLICMMIGLGILFFVVQTKKLKVNEPSDNAHL